MICSKCKIEKELTEFSKDKHNKTWYTTNCKECRNEYKRKYRATYEWAVKTKNYRILHRLNPEVKQREYEIHKKWVKEHNLTEYRRNYYRKKREHILELRRERENNYFRVWKKVYYNSLVWKIRNVVFKKWCLVEFQNWMRLWLGKYKLKPFKKTFSPKM